MNCISIKHASKSYRSGKNEVQILNNINLTIKKGDIYALIGASGCGKTTLISCILGIKKIENGQINVFGRKVKFGKISAYANRIGYMPQKNSLVPQLTIHEILCYYANLQEMSATAVEQRVKILTNLLQLPTRDSLISNLSGGEQRRLSLAIALIHNPELLILDEPTVGLDCEISSKIWYFLQTEAQSSNLTVLFTTHYWNEAAKASRCGFIRGGQLIIDNPPRKILEEVDACTLDEAFYKLAVEEKTLVQFECNESCETYSNIEGFGSKFLRKKVVGGLILREFYRIKKLPWEVFSVLFFGLLCLMVFRFSFGNVPDDLKVAVVINGTKNSLQTQFLELVTGFSKIPYEAYHEAYEDFQNGKIYGLIALNSNFTKDVGGRDEAYEFDGIEIHFDETKKPFLIFSVQRIQSAFRNLIDYAETSKLTDLLLLMYGLKLEGPQISSAMEAALPFVAIIFAFGIRLDHSIQFFSEYQVQGTWQRSLVNGLKSSEILASNLIITIIHALITALQMTLGLKIILNNEIIGDIWIVYAVVFHASFLGGIFGFALSILSNTTALSATIGSSILIIHLTATGVLWPLEGAPVLLKIFSYAAPVTLPSTFLRDVIFKGSNIHHASLIGGVASMTLWTIFLMILSCVALEKRKFSDFKMF